MPKTQHIERGEILKAAAEIVRERGERGLTVRAIAQKLSCSTQPVYSVFNGGMDELHVALIEEAKRQYHVRIEGYLSESDQNRYEAYGMGFVRFAREERGLFRLLFLSETCDFTGLGDPFLEEILGEMQALYRMPRETALAFHKDMAIFSYGLALLAYGDSFSDAEISEALKREFYALYAFYLPERPHFWQPPRAEDKKTV